MNKLILFMSLTILISLVGCENEVVTHDSKQLEASEIVKKINKKDGEYMNFVQDLENSVQNGINNEIEYMSFNKKVELLNIEYNKLEEFYSSLEILENYSPEIFEALNEYKKASYKIETQSKRKIEDYKEYYKILYDDDYYKSLGFYQFEWKDNQNKYTEDEFLKLKREEFIENNNIVKFIAERDGQIEHLNIIKENAYKVIINK